MSVCKAYQRLIAMASVQPLGEVETCMLREHLKQCPACRGYADELKGIVDLYTQDAERPLAPLTHSIRRPEPEPTPWLKWLFPSPRPAIIVVGMLLLYLGSFLFREAPVKKPVAAAVATPIATVPSVGDSRRLANADLEDLIAPQSPTAAKPVEFVFSIRTRQVDP